MIALTACSCIELESEWDLQLRHPSAASCIMTLAHGSYTEPMLRDPPHLEENLCVHPVEGAAPPALGVARPHCLAAAAVMQPLGGGSCRLQCRKLAAAGRVMLPRLLAGFLLRRGRELLRCCATLRKKAQHSALQQAPATTPEAAAAVGPALPPAPVHTHGR